MHKRDHVLYMQTHMSLKLHCNCVSELFIHTEHLYRTGHHRCYHVFAKIAAYSGSNCVVLHAKPAAFCTPAVVKIFPLVPKVLLRNVLKNSVPSSHKTLNTHYKEILNIALSYAEHPTIFQRLDLSLSSGGVGRRESLL